MTDLLRQTGRAQGYSRLGGNVESAMQRGIAFLKDAGRIEVDSDGRCMVVR